MLTNCLKLHVLKKGNHYLHLCILIVSDLEGYPFIEGIRDSIFAAGGAHNDWNNVEIHEMENDCNRLVFIARVRFMVCSATIHGEMCWDDCIITWSKLALGLVIMHRCIMTTSRKCLCVLLGTWIYLIWVLPLDHVRKLAWILIQVHIYSPALRMENTPPHHHHHHHFQNLQVINTALRLWSIGFF